MKATLEARFNTRTLRNLLRYLGQSYSSGHLHLVKMPGREGDIYLDNGRIVHAVMGSEQGLPALVNLLSLDEGDFNFYESVPAPVSSLRILLEDMDNLVPLRGEESSEEGMVIIDEELPSLAPDSVLVTNTDSMKEETMALTFFTMQLIMNLDGNLTLMEIASKMKMSLTEVIKGAQELLSEGMIALQSAPPVNPEFFEDFAQLSISVLGPIADIVVEDMIYDMGHTPETVPHSAVPELIDRVKAKIARPEWEKTFLAKAWALYEEYEI